MQAERSGDFPDEPGAAVGWRPATRKAAVGAYGRWLAYLADHGRLDPDIGPVARMTPAAVGDYLAYLRAGRSSIALASYVGVLSLMVQAMAPESDWRWLHRLHARLRRRAEPSRNKRSRIVSSIELVQLGRDLMAYAETIATDRPLKAAVDFRDGLMIALLAARPLRQRNFLGIEIGRHLVPVGVGYALCFEAGETKTGRAIEIPFPHALLPELRRYLSCYRPYLLALGQSRGASRQRGDRHPGARLWVSQYGLAMSASAQQASLEKHTRTRFGHVVNAHLFRTCAATTVATEDPEHARISAQILGHANFRTTERYYIQAATRVSSRQYHDQIQSIRAAAKRSVRRPHGER